MTIDELKKLSRQDLVAIAREYGINYIKERKKAELVEVIAQQDAVRHQKVPPGKKVVGYFLDGSFILEDA
jgi:hypothetical protein